MGDSVQRVEEQMRRDKECLLAYGENIHYKRGQDLFYQGHDPCGVYWIQKGRVALIRPDPRTEPSEERKAGNLLGLEELLNGEAFGYSARAAADCEICFIPKIVFLDWMEEVEQERR